MSSSSTLIPSTLTRAAPATAHAVLRLLRGIRHGSLALQLPDGGSITFGTAADDEPRAALRLRSGPATSALRRVTSPGTGPRPI